MNDQTARRELDGLLCAYVIYSDGRNKSLSWQEVEEFSGHGDAFLWLHLDRSSAHVEEWLSERSGLDPIDVDALLADETRPRFTLLDTAAHCNLRGINFNPGEAEEDMVSIRLWIEPTRVISTCRRPLRAVEDIREILAKGNRIRTNAGLVALFADSLVNRIGAAVESVDEELDALEESVSTSTDIFVRDALGRFRRKAVQLRRFVAPQRDALLHFANSDADWLSERARRRLQEVADEVTRIVEALNSIWERAAILQEEVLARHSEQTNRRLYLLSIVAAIFLPLGFVAGLLGVNLGGIPGADKPFGFAVLCLLLVVLTFLLVWLFRRFRWF
jgi:zinc transporter